MAKVIREKYKIPGDENPTMLRIANQWETDRKLLRTFFTDDQEKKELSGGYYQDMSLGFTNASHVLRLAFNAKDHPYRELVNEVKNASEKEIVRVLLVYSLNGGEGRSTGAVFPGMLRERCGKDENLSIALLLVGDIEGYPAKPNEPAEDLAQKIKGALENFPDDIMEQCDYVFYSDLPDNTDLNDRRFIQAEKYKESGNQTKHPHAVQLSHYGMIWDYFHDKNVPALRKAAVAAAAANLPLPKAKVCISDYTKQTVNISQDVNRNWIDWETLGINGNLPLKESIASRIRFAFVMKYMLQEDLNDPDLMEDVPLFRNVYKDVYTGLFSKKLRPDDKMKLGKYAYTPAKAVTAREFAFIEWLLNIGFTGASWDQKDPDNPQISKSVTSLWNQSKIRFYFSPKNTVLKDTDNAGLFNSLTEWRDSYNNPDNPANGKEISPHQAINNVTTSHQEIAVGQMIGILQEIYNIVKI